MFNSLINSLCIVMLCGLIIWLYFLVREASQCIDRLIRNMYELEKKVNKFVIEKKVKATKKTTLNK